MVVSRFSSFDFSGHCDGFDSVEGGSPREDFVEMPLAEKFPTTFEILLSNSPDFSRFVVNNQVTELKKEKRKSL